MGKIQNTPRPTLCIDLKKRRIRIHKNTLCLLGKPDYIQILINPEVKMIAIRPTTRHDRLALNVRFDHFPSENNYELYSTGLISNLLSVNCDWKLDGCYRIYGAMHTTMAIALFPMNEAIPVEYTKSSGGI